ncbi:Nodule Cysteine-Rich (NCR) secreted peptide [Medicago truncatula]|uniref:Nodule Cysteine-Rich (NCR) secreted peptide n=1 Tax=Medicago truncatula TaxID=3880 RepID=A0A072UKJ7_MEDTR|nr:Nodule Cysteine-Rich (NCR) secreted peptide [Medicago truncatula]
MAQFLIFVYALIIFLFPFLIEASTFRLTFFFLIVNAVNIRCVTVDDCPKVIKPLLMWCINKYCQYYFSEIP